MSSGDFAIETEGLTKRFGERTAISDVDLRVSRGCAFGYLGPNGAGVAIAALLAWQFIVVPLVVHLRLDSVVLRRGASPHRVGGQQQLVDRGGPDIARGMDATSRPRRSVANDDARMLRATLTQFPRTG